MGPSRWKVAGPHVVPSSSRPGLTFGECFTQPLDSVELPPKLHHLTLRYAEPWSPREGAAAEAETTVLFVPGPGEGVWSLRSGKNAKKIADSG